MGAPAAGRRLRTDYRQMWPKIPLTAAFAKLVPGQNARAETLPDRYDLANAHKRESSQT
jgi:hypothetical protein